MEISPPVSEPRSAARSGRHSPPTCLPLAKVPAGGHTAGTGQAAIARRLDFIDEFEKQPAPAPAQASQADWRDDTEQRLAQVAAVEKRLLELARLQEGHDRKLADADADANAQAQALQASDSQPLRLHQRSAGEVEVGTLQASGEVEVGMVTVECTEAAS
eukprot:SAG22_NODE_7138_length_772_cov_0.900446_1_plen_159_part_01